MENPIGNGFVMGNGLLIKSGKQVIFKRLAIPTVSPILFAIRLISFH